MNNRISQFNELLQKYKFKSSVPRDMQQFMISTKRAVLIDVFKEAGEYKLIFGLALRIYFGAKRIGVSLSYLQSMILLGITMLIFVTAIAARLYFIIDNNIFDKEKIKKVENRIESRVAKEENRIEKRNIKQGDRIAPSKQGEFIPLRYRLGVQPFTAENVDDKTAVNITDEIVSNLIEVIGKENVINLRMGRSKNVNLMVMGSIGKLGDTYMVSAKLVDVEKSKVVFVTSENIESEDKSGETCFIITNRLIEKIKMKSKRTGNYPNIK